MDCREFNDLTREVKTWADVNRISPEKARELMYHIADKGECKNDKHYMNNLWKTEKGKLLAEAIIENYAEIGDNSRGVRSTEEGLKNLLKEGERRGLLKNGLT